MIRIKEDIEEIIQDEIGDRKCTAIFDSVGSGKTINQYLPLLEESGTYVNLAVHNTTVNFDAAVLGSERTLTTSSNAFYSDLKEAFNLLNSGKIDVKPWITHHFPLEDYQRAFELLLKSPKEAYKVVFEPYYENLNNGR